MNKRGKINFGECTHAGTFAKELIRPPEKSAER